MNTRFMKNFSNFNFCSSQNFFLPLFDDEKERKEEIEPCWWMSERWRRWWWKNSITIALLIDERFNRITNWIVSLPPYLHPILIQYWIIVMSSLCLGFLNGGWFWIEMCGFMLGLSGEMVELLIIFFVFRVKVLYFVKI